MKQPVVESAPSGPATTTARRLLILSDSPYFYPPFTAGGSVGQLRSLAHEFRRLGMSVTVVARRSATDHAGAGVVDGGISIRYLGPGGEQRGKGWAALLPNLLYMARIFKFMLLRSRDYDVALVSGFRLLALPAGLAVRLRHRTCLVRIEDSNDLNFGIASESARSMGLIGRQAMALSVRALYWMGFKTAHRLVAFSPQIAAGLIRMGASASKIAHIPNGIDSNLFTPVDTQHKRQLRQRLGIGDQTVFIYTGRLSHAKGIMLLLEVWRLLVQERSDICLLMLGSGGDSFDSCEAEARDFIATHGLQNSIVLPGTVANTAEYLQASDLFIFLSKRENFSVSVLEALAAGLPSVLTRVGGVEELPPGLGNEIVDITDPAPVVLAHVRKLLDRREEWPRIARHGRDFVVRQYTIAAVARAYLELMEAPRATG